MTDDLLPYLAHSLPLRSIDTTLSLLTHRNTLIRRIALILFFFPIYLTLYSALRRSSHPHGRFQSSTTSPALSDDFNASNFIPTSPTVAQSRSYLALLDRIDGRSSAYNVSLFTPTALASDSTKVVGVTAVVLAWKRRRGLQLVVKHVSTYPFIREIIVWNNRGGAELVESDFILSSPPGLEQIGTPTLRIINSPNNVHDAGKHLACSLAKYRHCYFNDDDWLNIYMDSLYTKYLECCAGGGGPGRGGSGGRIASNTMPIIHLEHRRWRFENPDTDLHTGFTWLGTGSFAPRHLSSRFMNQQSVAPVGLDRSQSLVADMFFSLWTNSYPEQMPNDLVAIDVDGEEVGWSRSDGVDQWAVVYGNILAAVRSLSDILKTSRPHLTPAPFPLAPPPPESHTRAPCADDTCLFTTSLTPFSPPTALTFPPEKQGWFSRPTTKMARFDPWKVKDVREYEKLWDGVAGGWPTGEWWTEKGSWHLAVDDKGVDTCWESWKPPGLDDHFGVTLISPMAIRVITLVGSQDLGHFVGWATTGAAEAWELFTDSGSGWESRRLSYAPLVRVIEPTKFEVDLELEPHAIPTIRKFKFVSRSRKSARLLVCSIALDGWVLGELD